MSIILENETDFDITQEHNDLINKVINETLDYVKCPYEVEVSITIVTNDEIKILNNEYRETDSETDVLSFPLIEYKKPADFSVINGEDDEYFNFDTGELMLGDIVLSYEKMQEQAQSYGHSVERELGFLIVHSMLHLVGYDHMDTEEEKNMFFVQDCILEKVGLVR